jgi:hypothetical protein
MFEDQAQRLYYEEFNERLIMIKPLTLKIKVKILALKLTHYFQNFYKFRMVS